MPLPPRSAVSTLSQNKLDSGLSALVDHLLRTEDVMYAAEFNADATSKHSRHCKSMFARRDWDCHRCVELELGAAPRNGWQHEYFARKLRQYQRSFKFPD